MTRSLESMHTGALYLADGVLLTCAGRHAVQCFMACLFLLGKRYVILLSVEGMRDAKTLNWYAGSLPNPLSNRGL